MLQVIIVKKKQYYFFEISLALKKFVKSKFKHSKNHFKKFHC